MIGQRNGMNNESPNKLYKMRWWQLTRQGSVRRTHESYSLKFLSEIKEENKVRRNGRWFEYQIDGETKWHPF